MDKLPGYLPNPLQVLLLKAALLKDESASIAWEQWRSQVDISRVSHSDRSLFPLLYRNLTQLQWHGSIPSALKHEYRQTWFRNQRIFHVAQSAISAFAKVDIEMLLLKGAALMLDYYQDHHLRSMYDVDVLIPFGRIRQAREILEDMGLALTIPLPDHRIPLIHGSTFRTADHVDFDLHWHMLEECCLLGDDDPYWQAALPAEFMGIQLLTLCPTDLLFNVLVHAARWEVEQPIKWVADAWYILQASDINWDRLLSLAHERDLLLPVRDTLSYLSRTFDVTIPSDVIRDLDESRVTLREIHEYRIKSSPRTYMRRLLFHWFNFLRLKSVIGKRNILVGFQSYLQHRWGIENLRSLPAFIANELAERTRSGFSNITPDDPIQRVVQSLSSHDDS